MAKEKKDIRVFASKLEAELLKEVKTKEGKEKLKEGVYKVINSSLKDFFEKEEINGAEVLLKRIRNLEIQPRVDEHNIKSVKESLGKLGVSEKDRDSRFEALGSALEGININVDQLLEAVEEAREKGIKDIERNKDIKKCVAKVVFGALLVIGSIAAIAGFVALAVATGMAPAVVVAAAAGVGITASTTVAIGGVTVGLAGAAAAVAGAGILLDVISGGALAYTLGKIEKSAANDVIKLDEKLAGEVTNEIHNKIRDCKMVELGVREFVKKLSVQQGRN